MPAVAWKINFLHTDEQSCASEAQRANTVLLKWAPRDVEDVSRRSIGLNKQERYLETTLGLLEALLRSPDKFFLRLRSAARQKIVFAYKTALPQEHRTQYAWDKGTLKPP